MRRKDGTAEFLKPFEMRAGYFPAREKSALRKGSRATVARWSPAGETKARCSGNLQHGVRKSYPRRHGIANHSVASVKALGDPYFVFTCEAKHGSMSVDKPRGTWVITLVNHSREGQHAALQVRAYTLAVRAFSELPRQDLCDAKHIVGKIAAGHRGFVPRVTCHLSPQEAGGSLLTGEGSGSYFMQMSHVRTPGNGRTTAAFPRPPSTQVQAWPGLWHRCMLRRLLPRRDEQGTCHFQAGEALSIDRYLFRSRDLGVLSRRASSLGWQGTERHSCDRMV